MSTMDEDAWLGTPEGEQWLQQFAASAAALSHSLQRVSRHTEAVRYALSDVMFDHGAVTPDGISARLTKDFLGRVAASPP